jgi:hypothetical protein
MSVRNERRALRRSRERSPNRRAAIGEFHDGCDQRRAVEQGAVVVVGILHFAAIPKVIRNASVSD